MSLQQSVPPWVFDSSSLINFERTGNLEHLTELGDWVLIPVAVAREVSYKADSQAALWLKRNPSRVVGFQSDDEEGLYWKLRQQKEPYQVHDGEASAIALARFRKGTLVCDESKNKPAMQKASHLDVSCLACSEFLKQIIPQF